ncbi:uncharacterized protein N7483_006233 [Penicillium malachiteum]|uniref:uncharacterized protein n=1 Tax=Penicillium malachiteum TaxID=1324776 RepID=UPI002547D604|nr:uncharacterized protein N7483_006233 [Penicillium malachiteum]KAJ5731725.1 hypothetical protein N7483_006233 [Penicillium malachiteum]
MNFLDLPPELHLLIFKSLTMEDILKLRITCTHFFQMFPQITHEQLLEAESTAWASEKNLYACRYCLRLRPACQFADRMLGRGRTRLGTDRDKRFCVECGVKPRDGPPRYGPGSQFTFQGQACVICILCHQFRPAAFNSDGRGTRHCEVCWSGRIRLPAKEPPSIT